MTSIDNAERVINIPYNLLSNDNTDIDQFKLSKSFVDKYKTIRPNFGFNGLGELVYQRTYSRLRKDGKKEKWYQTVERVVNGVFNMQKFWIIKNSLSWNEEETQKIAQEMYDRIFKFKFMPPGRGLWAMGTDVTLKRGLYAALNNCAFVSLENLELNKDPSKPFCFLMDASMLGVGVGFDTKCTMYIKGVDKEKPKKLYTIPDSREGWVESLKLLLNSYFLNTEEIEFDYSLIRPIGELIKTFGGVSSGPDPLIKLHEKIREILDNATHTNMSSRIIADIMNLIGVCVVSGNVRRTAEIMFGDYKDEEYINLKNYTLNPDRASHGWTSNNSVFADVGMDYSKITERIKDNGEPGLAWLSNMQEYSRMSDVKNYKDHKVKGGNPCISVDSWIMTTDGVKQIKDLIGLGQQSLILNGKEYKTDKYGFFNTGFKTLYKLKTKEGYEIKATLNHLFRMYNTSDSNLKWKELGSLKQGDKIMLNNHSSINELSCEIDRNGFLYKKTFARGIEMYKLIMLKIKNDNLDDCNLITVDIEKSKYWFYIAYLSGLFNHSLLHSEFMKSNIILQYNYETLQSIQRMLLRVGVFTRIQSSFINAECDCDKFKDKSDDKLDSSFDSTTVFNLKNCCSLKNFNSLKNMYSLIVDNVSINYFIHLFGNVLSKTDKNYYNMTFSATVENIEKYKDEEVYDCTVPDISAFDANGFYVHNCLEQSLESYELCCLVETFINNHDSLVDYLKTLKYAYLYAKTVTLGATHWSKTNDVMARNRRIGCSITGIAQFLGKNNIDVLKQWCNEGYDAIQSYDKEFSDRFAIPRSIKTTSIKPSGTVSLLGGATPGMHYPESRYYIRRVRLAKTSELIPALEDAGYNVEPALESPDDTSVVEFPIDVGEVKTINEINAWSQTALAAFLQEWWADNQVSCTVTFKKEEGDQLKDILDFYQYKLKGISFLPRFENSTAYKQMPYESINHETYLKLSSNLKELNFDMLEQQKDPEMMDKYCSNDKCML